MPNLIAFLLDQYRPQVRPSKMKIKMRRTNLQPDLNQLAIDIFNNAVKEMQKNHRQQKWLKYFNIEAHIQHSIATQLTLLLSEIGLLDENKYQCLQEIVKNWRPRHAQEQHKCDRVKQEILKLLPAARQKQQLLQICHEYKSHLKTAIELEISENFPQEFQVYCKPHVDLVLSRSRGYQQQAIEAKDMDFFVNQSARRLPINSGALQLGIEKYQVVGVLQKTLCSSKPAPIQVNEFRQQLQIHRTTIEKRRDKPSVTFLKAIATFFSLGAALLAGIWNVKGQKTINNAEKILQPAVAA